MMNIRRAYDSDREQWDNFVENHAEATPYHLFAWTKAIQNAYGFEVVRLMAEDCGEILGVLPVVKIEIPLFKSELVALPYCDIGTVLAKHVDVQLELINELLQIAKSKLVSNVDIRGIVKKECISSYGVPVRTESNKVRMLLDLPSSSEELWTGFKSKLRSQIRKAEKNDLTFQFANNRIDDFYSVFCLNMRDLGSPVHSKKWFKEIICQFEDNVKVGLVYHQKKTIGAGIILRVGNKISIPWASTLRKRNHLSPNMLLYWSFLKHAADNGCQEFDFGRSTPGEGTFKFKAQWGAMSVPLIWNRWFVKGKPSSATQLSKNYNKKIELFWTKIPLNIANYLGPKIRRYISL